MISAAMTLDDVCARLVQHPQVDGILLIGSAQETDVPAHADYDMVIVLADNPLRLHVGVTTIAARLTDLIFVDRTHVETILTADQPIDPGDWSGRLAVWLADSTLRFDRHGQLAAAQRKSRASPVLRALDEIDVTQARFSLNYNVAQTARLLASDDPVYRLAALVRMQWFGVGDLLTHYLTIRQQPWRGEKAAIRYLQAHDAGYLARFEQFMVETDPSQKFQLYRQLAQAAAAPAGGLWPSNTTALQLERAPEQTASRHAEAKAFWEALIRGESP